MTIMLVAMVGGRAARSSYHQWFRNAGYDPAMRTRMGTRRSDDRGVERL
jgi:hypothetical protein